MEDVLDLTLRCASLLLPQLPAGLAQTLTVDSCHAARIGQNVKPALPTGLPAPAWVG